MSVTIEDVARHEAGHAVVRWLVGWPLTALTARHDGSGFTAGTGGTVRRDDYLRVTLAGPAAEIWMLAELIDWDVGSFADFELCRQHMTESAMRILFRHVCDELWPQASLIEEIAARLTLRGTLSARSVAALCREHRKRARQKVEPRRPRPRGTGVAPETSLFLHCS